ncbi:MAG: hypothetical protein P4L53_05365 [Candidatus Obscuribacterales bacterium]|nr:hypothetical protein [Candidatus Obscuribacterales bacterium]
MPVCTLTPITESNYVECKIRKNEQAPLARNHTVSDSFCPDLPLGQSAYVAAKGSKVKTVAESLMTLCQAAKLAGTDFGKAIWRIELEGTWASISDLSTTSSPKAGPEEQFLARALRAFRRLQSEIES